MHAKNTFRHLLLAILSVTALCFNLSYAGAPNMMFNPPSMEEIEAQIDEFVRSLPPEQQKQFYKDVEELTGIMEKMSPDELSEFVGSVFTEAGLIEPGPAPMPQPEAKKVEPTVVKEAKPGAVITTAPSGPTETAINMLKTIIARTQEFMRKALMIPELPGTMDKWVRQEKLREIPTSKVNWKTLDWSTVEKQIDDFSNLLHKLQEVDDKTGQYRHIGNLIKDVALYSNLNALEVILTNFVPDIKVPDFGLDKTSEPSLKAIRQVLNQYLESFHLLNVPTSIENVLKLYEPRAKELSEEEAALVKKAKEEAQKPRVSTPGVKTPGTKAPSTGYEPSYGYGDYYGGDYGYMPSYSPHDYFGPSSDYGPTPSTGGGTFGAGKGAGAGAGKPGEAKKEEKEGGKEGKEGAKKEEGKPGAKKDEVKKESDTDRKLWKLQDKIEAVIDSLKAFDVVFTKFKDQFATGFDKTFIDTKLQDLVLAIQTADKEIKKSIEDIKAFKKSLDKMNKPTQDYYKKELTKAFKDSVKFLETLETDIKNIEEKAGSPFRSELNKDKLYVYFGEGTGSADVVAKLPTPPVVTMKNLAETIRKLKDAAK